MKSILLAAAIAAAIPTPKPNPERIQIAPLTTPAIPCQLSLPALVSGTATSLATATTACITSATSASAQFTPSSSPTFTGPYPDTVFSMKPTQLWAYLGEAREADGKRRKIVTVDGRSGRVRCYRAFNRDFMTEAYEGLMFRAMYWALCGHRHKLAQP